MGTFSGHPWGHSLATTGDFHTAMDTPLLLLVGAQWGRALSPVDAHLLSSALLSPGTQSWTRDKGLKASATKLHAVTVD